MGIRLDTRTGKLVKQCGGTLKKCLSVEAKDGQAKYVALKLNSLRKLGTSKFHSTTCSKRCVLGGHIYYMTFKLTMIVLNRIAACPF